MSTGGVAPSAAAPGCGGAGMTGACGSSASGAMRASSESAALLPKAHTGDWTHGAQGSGDLSGVGRRHGFRERLMLTGLAVALGLCSVLGMAVFWGRPAAINGGKLRSSRPVQLAQLPEVPGDMAQVEQLFSEASRDEVAGAATNITLLTRRPRSDRRTFQFAVLKNGLEVLNIQDKETFRFAAAVAVKAGSYNDPVKLPGLAHFCEHMVFLGTKKYPRSGGFDDFMTAHGGSDNAYTASEVTVYYGGLAEGAMKEMMGRLSDFFRHPLFRHRYVKKEVHAINSEHLKNIENPERRILETLDAIADPRSPVSRFKTGNIETLYDGPKRKGVDPVAALKTYFGSHYCPSRMRLVTTGSASVDEQLELAEQTFGHIPEGSKACRAPPRTFESPPPYPKKRMGKWVAIEGSEPTASMWVHWQLHDLTKEYRSQPLEYVNHVLSYDGVDSLVRTLQDSFGLVTSVDVFADMSSAGTSLYLVTRLTDTGRERADVVLDVIYAYLASLVHAGVNEELYSSLADLKKLQWDWMAPSGPQDTSADFAERMTRLPPEDLLTGDFLIDRKSVDMVVYVLSKLTPENMNVAIVDRDAERHGLFRGGTVQHLRHWAVNFTVEPLKDILLGAPERWSKWLGDPNVTNCKVGLRRALRQAHVAPTSTTFPKPPGPIVGIPKELSLKHMHAKKAKSTDSIEMRLFGPKPTKIKVAEPKAPAEAKGATVWWRSGWVTQSPKVAIQAIFRPLRKPSEPHLSALDNFRLRVYGALLSEEVYPRMVDMTLAGADYSLGVDQHSGLSFIFSGFEPLLPHLATTLLAAFNRFNNNLRITQKSRFDRIIEEYKKDLSSYTDMPMSYALADRSLLLQPGTHAREETLAIIDNVTLMSAAMSAGELVLSRPLQLTALAMGNLDAEQAAEIVDTVSTGIQLPKWLHYDSDVEGEIEYVTKVVNPKNPVEVRATNPRENDPNDATIISILNGVMTVESQVTLGILGRILQNVIWNELRTKRQLGYVVEGGYGVTSNVDYLVAIVQGVALDADGMEAAIEGVFANQMPAKLRNMTEAEFQSFKDALVQSLIEPPKSASSEQGHYWFPIKSGGRCFDYNEQVLRYLNSSLVSRKSIAAAWDQAVNPVNASRKQITVKYYSDRRKVPPRPSNDEFKKLLQHDNVPDSTQSRLVHERSSADVFDHRPASTDRARLEKSGGYFPTTMNCELQPDTVRLMEQATKGKADLAEQPTVAPAPASTTSKTTSAAPSTKPAASSTTEPPQTSAPQTTAPTASPNATSAPPASQPSTSLRAPPWEETRAEPALPEEPPVPRSRRFAPPLPAGEPGGARRPTPAPTTAAPPVPTEPPAPWLPSAEGPGGSGVAASLMSALGSRASELAAVMSAEDVAGTLDAYGRLSDNGRPSSDILNALAGRAEALGLEMTGVQLADTVNAFAKLQFWPRAEFWTTCGRRIEQVVDHMNARNVTSVVNAYAVLGVIPDDEPLAQLARRAESVADDMDAEDVVLSLIAYAKLWRRHEWELLDSIRGGKDMNAENGANVFGAYAGVWRLSQLQHLGASLLKALSAQASVVADDMNSAEVASTLVSLAALGVQPDDWFFTKMGHRIEAVGAYMTPHDATRTLDAFGKLGHRPPRSALVVLEHRCLHELAELDAHDIAALVGSFAWLGTPPGETDAPAIIARAAQVAGGMSARDAAHLLHSLASLHLEPGQHLLVAINARLRVVAGDLDAQDIARIYIAAAAIGLPLPDPTKLALERRAEKIGPSLSASGVAAVLMAYLKLDQLPRGSLLTVLARRAEELAPKMDAERIAGVLDAYTQLWQKVSAASLASLSGDSAASLASLPGGGTDAESPPTLAAVADLDADGERGPRGAMRLVLMAHMGKAFVNAAGRRIVEVAPRMSAHCVALSFGAYAQLRESPGDDVLTALAKRLQEVVDDMNAPDVARTIDSYQKLRVMQGSW